MVGVALARPRQLVDFAAEHTTFVAGAAIIAGLAALLAGRARARRPRRLGPAPPRLGLLRRAGLPERLVAARWPPRLRMNSRSESRLR